MKTIIKKISTMLSGIRKRGLYGFFRYYFLESDRKWMGLLVEMTGNRVRMDGMIFSVDASVMPQSNKSQLVQGRFERDEREAVKKYLDPALPVIELGGSIGVVACTTNRLLDYPEQHVVVEASPIFAETLQENRELNNCSFTIINRAIAYGSETVKINYYGFSTGIYTISEDKVEVPTTTLETILNDHAFETFTLVSDIEGAEVDVVRQEPHILKSRVKAIMVELHPHLTGSDEVSYVRSKLSELGFQETEQFGQTYVFINQAFA